MFSIDLPVFMVRSTDSAVALMEQPPPERTFSKAPLKFLIISIIANKTAQTCHHHDLQIFRLIEMTVISYNNSWVLNFPVFIHTKKIYSCDLCFLKLSRINGEIIL